MISLIFQVIVSLPKIISLVSSVVKAIKDIQIQSQEARLAGAILKAQEAKTKAEASDANSDITRNLP